MYRKDIKLIAWPPFQPYIAHPSIISSLSDIRLPTQIYNLGKKEKWKEQAERWRNKNTERLGRMRKPVSRTIKELVEPLAKRRDITRYATRKNCSYPAPCAMIYRWKTNGQNICQSFNSDKELFEGKRTCFPDTSGHLDWDSFNKRAPVPKRNWDPRERERGMAKDEIWRRVSWNARLKAKQDELRGWKGCGWKEASPGAATCSKGY